MFYGDMDTKKDVGVPWTDLATNEYDYTSTEENVVTIIKLHTSKHIFRGNIYEMFQLILKGKIEGRTDVLFEEYSRIYIE